MINTDKIKIASKYALALVEIGEEKNILAELEEDISNIKNALIDSELSDFLNNKNIPKDNKKNTLKDIFKDKISDYTLNLLNVLVDSGRSDMLDEIIFCFENKTDNIKNIEKVFVTSAIELNDETKTRIIQTLEKKLNKQIKLNTQIDEKIISGLIIKIQDNVLDLSLKAKFDNILEQLV